tara:strand:+ start:626 stop:859 length:234 start_codon:yes stop_codon:yes gene_type:complete
MKIIFMFLMLSISGCAVTPTYDKGTLVWVGCHKVEQNPSPEGSTAVTLFSKLNIGDLMYLQQINSKGDPVVTVGDPC